MLNIFRLLICFVIAASFGTDANAFGGSNLNPADRKVGGCYFETFDTDFTTGMKWSGGVANEDQGEFYYYAGGWVPFGEFTEGHLEACINPGAKNYEYINYVGTTADGRDEQSLMYVKFKFDKKIYKIGIEGKSNTQRLYEEQPDPDYVMTITATGGGGQNAVVGKGFANELQVTAKYGNGDVLEGVEVAFSCTGSEDSACATFDPTSATTDANGIAKVTATANDVVGAYTVTATVVSDPTKTATFNLENKSADAVDPKVTIAAPKTFDFGVPFEVTFTFNEDVTGFDSAGDIDVTNGTAAAPTGSGKIYKAMITPSSNDPVTIKVLADVADDTAGNPNEESNVVVVQPADTDGPTVTIAAPETFDFGMPFEVTFTFDEDVTGFDSASDITVTNGTASAPIGSGFVYTSTITPNGTGDVTIQVKAGVAEDAAGNPNTASEVVTVKGTVVEETQKNIANYMINRAHSLINSQPDLIGFLSDGNGSFEGSGSENTGSFNMHTGYNSNSWAQVSASWSKIGAAKSSYFLGSIGAHYEISKNLFVGAMLEVDHGKTNDEDAQVSGTGWLVGPYVTAKLPNHPLYFEGRALYGLTYNKVKPFGTYEDSFKTKRFYARAKIAGDINLGQLTLTPNVMASYTHDKQLSYTDTLGNLIPEQSIALGELSAGLDFSVPIQLGVGKLRLNGGVAGIFSHTKATGFARNQLKEYDGGRARVKLGIDYQYNEFVTFGLNGFYDGIFVDDQEAYGGDAKVSVRF